MITGDSRHASSEQARGAVSRFGSPTSATDISGAPAYSGREPRGHGGPIAETRKASEATVRVRIDGSEKGAVFGMSVRSRRCERKCRRLRQRSRTDPAVPPELAFRPEVGEVVGVLPAAAIVGRDARSLCDRDDAA